MKKEKMLAAGVLLTAQLFLISGCGSEPQPETEPTPSPVVEKAVEIPAQKETWTFIDQADNEVTVQIPVERMAVMQHHSLDILAQLGAQDQIIATESKWEKNLGTYINEVFPGISNLPTPGDLKEWNVEELGALKPDVVIAASQANQETAQKIRDLGIPVVVVSMRGEGKQEEAQNPRLSNADLAYTEGCEWAVKTLGKLTGREDRAEEIWNFCEESRALVEDAVGEIPDAERVRVFIANEGEQTYGNDKYVGCQLLRAGAINVAAEEIQGYKPYTFEKLAEWDPDVIIVQDRYKSVYDQIMTEDKYQNLKAVREGNVLLAPYWTKPWGNPDTDSIALGELWLAHQFYPEKVSAELVQERAEEFYTSFYGVPFTGTI